MNSVREKTSKTFLISGASSGVGKAIATYISSKGNIVYAGARKQEDINELNKIENVIAVKLDITNSSDIRNVVGLVENKHGKLDVLINNAGITGWGAIMDLNIEYFKDVMEVNLWGMINLTKSCYPLLRKSNQNPIIFNISSQGAKYVFPFWAPYHISKYGVRAYSDALRRELLPLKIRVCELQLGPFRSEAFSKQKDIYETYVNKFEKSEFTPRLISFFKKIIYSDNRREKSPRILGKQILKISEKRSSKVRYQPGKKLIASFMLTKLPPRWVDNLLLKMFSD